MGIAKLLAGTVVVIGVIKIVERPEVQQFVRENFGVVSRASDNGPTMVSRSRDENFRRGRSGQPSARVIRRRSQSNPYLRRPAHELRRLREQQRARVISAIQSYGRDSTRARRELERFRLIDEAYAASLRSSRS